jgi:hypothetical protein
MKILIRTFVLCVSLMVAALQGALAQQTETATSATTVKNVAGGEKTELTIAFNNFEVTTMPGGKSILVKLKVEYNRTEKEMKLTFLNLENDTFVLKDNLNNNIFHHELIEKLVKYPNGQNEVAFNEYGINQIFLWLYTLVFDEPDEKIGKLNFRKWVMVLDGDKNNSALSARAREELLYERASTYQDELNLRDGYKANIKRELAALQLLDDKLLKEAKEDIDKKVAANAKLKKGAKKIAIPALPTVTPLRYDTLIKKFDAGMLTPDDIKNMAPITADQAALYSAKSAKLETYFSELDQKNAAINSEKNKVKNDSIFAIKNISIQFERGHIEKIQVWVENKFRETDIYENIYAIGFTSIKNFRDFQRVCLFIRKNGKGYNNYIYLSDVIANYDNLLQLYTRDYSPADIAINDIDISQKIPAITLEKEKNIRLFDSRIYSDLAGFSEDAPNGLVQVEMSRRFNINTTRYQLGTRREDVSFLTYFNFTGTLSKIENKDRILPLRNAGIVENNTIVSPSYATNLDLRRYENSSIQLDLNLFLWDAPDNKITAYVESGFHYGHLRVADSTRKVENGVITDRAVAPAFGTNTFTFYPRFALELFSERRVGFSTSYQYNTTILFSNNLFKQVASSSKSDLSLLANDKGARGSHMLELGARVETSRDGNGIIFGRARFFWQNGDANSFFPQVQVGYAYNILFRK